MVHHGAAAVFDDDDLPVEPLDVGQSLDQDLGFVQVFLIDH